MFRILLAEDDDSTRRLMSDVLMGAGYEVTAARDGEEALQRFAARRPDLLVLDVMMPRRDGFEVLQKVRADGETLPILLVTAREAIEDKWRGFTGGADDYLVKPFNERELLLRAAALLRRSRIASERRLQLGDLTLSYDTLSARWGEEEIELPKKEFLLLFKLLASPGKIFTKRQLMEDVWEEGSESDEHTIEVHIGRLRDKFKQCGEFEIVTMRGLGYKAVKKG